MQTGNLTLKNSKLFWLAVFAIFLLFFYSVAEILFPFVVGIFFSYLLNPLVNRLEKNNIKRVTASALITSFLTLLILIGVILIIPSIFEQLVALLRDVPAYVEKVRNIATPSIQKFLNEIKIFNSADKPIDAKEKLSSLVNNYSGDLVYFMGNLLNKIIFSGTSILNFLSLLFVTPIVTFYVMKDWPSFVTNIKSLIPRKYLAVTLDLSKEVENNLSGFLRGQSNVCLILAFYYAVTLTLHGLQYGLLVGLLTGLFSFIPYVGFAIGLILALIISIFQFGDFVQIAITAGIFVFAQIIESYYLTPKLIGKKVGLHPVWIIFAVFAGGVMFGFTGILIALPLATVISVLVRFTIRQYKEGNFYLG
ncbi:MAG: AI-2E family transporter [Alphaproteobacteria bacterium]|jgi:predicted PurR-regulated permease PerM